MGQHDAEEFVTISFKSDHIPATILNRSALIRSALITQTYTYKTTVMMGLLQHDDK